MFGAIIRQLPKIIKGVAKTVGKKSIEIATSEAAKKIVTDVAITVGTQAAMDYAQKKLARKDISLEKKLDSLVEMREKGKITPEEYEILRKKTLDAV